MLLEIFLVVSEWDHLMLLQFSPRIHVPL